MPFLQQKKVQTEKLGHKTLKVFFIRFSMKFGNFGKKKKRGKKIDLIEVKL